MKTENYINQKVEDALSSLDNIKRAQASPYLYTRLTGRLAKTSLTFWEQLSLQIKKPLVAFAFMFLILLINFVAVYVNHPAANSSNNEVTEMAVNDEFPQATPTIFEIENIKP